jgi:phosphatidylinositol alpha-mannosyltransferase
VVFLGQVDEEPKARMLRSVDIYVAPNTGGESFGMILTEALAAGTPIVASDLEAFRRVLDDAGVIFPVEDADALALALGDLLDDPARRASLVARGREVVAPYDWEAVSRRVLEVYNLALEAAPRRRDRRRDRPRGDRGFFSPRRG